MALVAFNLLTKRITNDSKTKLVDDDLIQMWQALFDLVRPILTTYKFIKLPINEHPNIILTMTSCKRLDLFKQTVNSIVNTWIDLPLVDQFIVIDDNSSSEDRVNMMNTYPFITFVLKSEAQKGHVESMNMIFELLKEKNPSYWIHVEDDFLFFNEMPYITMGINGLNTLHQFNVKQIMFNRNYVETFDRINMEGHIPYSDSNYSLHDYKPGGMRCQYWPHFSFRPSIIDVESILNLGDFTSEQTFFEMEYAKKWTEAGYRTAFINTITNIHIGKLCNTPGENAYTLNDVPQFNSQKNDYNIKIINMTNRPDRLKTVTKKLQKAKLTFERIEAVNGKELTLTPELMALFKDNDFGFRRGVIGCALSHYYLWQRLIDSNDSYYVVMEDDVSLCSQFAERLGNIVKDNKHDLIFLGYHMTKHNKEIHSSYFTNTDDVKIEPLNTDLYIGGTHCYLITKEGAASLVDFVSMHGIKHGIDYLMAKLQKILPVNESVPHLAFADWVDTRESNVDSDIQNDFSPVALNVTDKYLFLEGLDQVNYDCYVAEKHLPKCDYEIMADSIEGCVAFNTMGFFKNKITELVKSPYFGSSDGIYVNKEYYFNNFKKKE